MSQSKRNKVKLLALWGCKNYNKFLRLLVRILWCFLSSFCFKPFTLCFTFRFVTRIIEANFVVLVHRLTVLIDFTKNKYFKI